tara:strand:- start:4589 stop:5752 length:1164 start_codon:yes stop_codon:yes gene_type:complete
MKIEVKLEPEIFGILPHQMVSQDQCSIIWEPSMNSFADWWCSMYVGREMYKQKQFTVLDSYRKLYNHWDSIDGHEALRKQTQKIRKIITEINEYIEDPKDYFPLKPKEVNIKLNSKGRQQLNTLHRYFVRIAYPTTAFNKTNMSYKGPRQKDDKGMEWAFNWHMDRPDYILEEPFKKYPGDFYIDRFIARDFIDKVEELNYGCHDIEPFFYEKSKIARNMLHHPGLVVEPTVSQKWRNKWYTVPEEYYRAEREDTKRDMIFYAKKRADLKDIPPYFEHFQSSDKQFDVWMPQNCILGKSTSIAYCDEDDPTSFDVNNGHQANFAFEFSDRKDRDYLRKIGYGGKNPYGWPLGRIVSGKELLEEIRSRFLAREFMHNKQLVKEIKVWK